MGGAQSNTGPTLLDELTGATSGKYYSNSDGVHMAGDEDLEDMIAKIRSEDKGRPPDWGLVGFEIHRRGQDKECNSHETSIASPRVAEQNSKAWQNMREMNGPSNFEKTVSRSFVLPEWDEMPAPAPILTSVVHARSRNRSAAGASRSTTRRKRRSARPSAESPSCSPAA